MSKRTKNAKGRAGRTKRNRQWIREHGVHRGRLFYGQIDRMTGQVVR